MLGKGRSKQFGDTIGLALLVVGVTLLVVGVLQLDNLEERVLILQRRIDALEGGGSLSQDGLPSNGNSLPGQRRWLNPDVPNALAPDPDLIDASKGPPGGTLFRWLGKEPSDLNPITSLGGSVKRATEHYVHERLADYHNHNPDKMAPRLAERVEITDDSKQYTVYLKKGVMWHMPAVDMTDPKYGWLGLVDREFTAEDVKFTLELYTNPQVESQRFRSYYEDVESCEIVDDYTVVIKWKKKTYNAIAFSLGIKPLPAFLYSRDESGELFPKETLGLAFNEHWYNKKVIGTGPYRFESWTKGKSIELVRNEEYWGIKPAIKGIIWRFGDNSEDMALKLKSGELDVANLRPTDYREEIQKGGSQSPFKDGSIQHGFYDQLAYSFIGWNQENPIFRDKRVRRAMTLCLDREALLERLFMGLGTVISTPFYHKSPYTDPDVSPLPFDPEGARNLLLEAGWRDSDGDGVRDKMIAGKRVDFKFKLLMTTGYAHWRDLAASLKESLYKVGVSMEVQEVDWAVTQKMRDSRKFDALLGFWGLYWFSDPYPIWHSSQSEVAKGSNFINYRNTGVDSLIETLRQTFDTQARIELARKIHRLIHDDQPYTFLFTRQRITAWRNRVRGIGFRPIPPHELSLSWYLKK